MFIIALQLVLFYYYLHYSYLNCTQCFRIHWPYQLQLCDTFPSLFLCFEDFVPIDLDEWWAQRFLANIDKLSWRSPGICGSWRTVRRRRLRRDVLTEERGEREEVQTKEGLRAGTVIRTDGRRWDANVDARESLPQLDVQTRQWRTTLTFLSL